ncbi:hypothetical protein O181_081765 [Austropuccinia psidii MF-1]|uniref:Reverse transcriptase Ty1/copia-type domain-containing protein n=1 Tax=Austropuccinia psidii MF-1 TaxID=1389203 RepID=A0A9Q3IK75_9BASI|nr:hypothetical protein [Austropuccinia psidii MF-1]
MEDLGKAKYALGIRITQETNCISLLKDKFIDRILEEFNLTNAKPTAAPLPGNSKDLKNPMEEQPQKVPLNYWRAIGLLKYLVQCTRPDLAFSVSFLSQFLETPRSSHFKAVEHVLKYLIGTKSFTLKLELNLLKHQQTSILGFSDADWGGTKEYKSFSGLLIYYFGTIGWRSHKEEVVALSSAEAEYNALKTYNGLGNLFMKHLKYNLKVSYILTTKVLLQSLQITSIIMEQDTSIFDYILSGT